MLWAEAVPPLNPDIASSIPPQTTERGDSSVHTDETKYTRQKRTGIPSPRFDLLSLRETAARKTPTTPTTAPVAKILYTIPSQIISNFLHRQAAQIAALVFLRRLQQSLAVRIRSANRFAHDRRFMLKGGLIEFGRNKSANRFPNHKMPFCNRLCRAFPFKFKQSGSPFQQGCPSTRDAVRAESS